MVLEGLQVISIADDILIPGCSATDTEARIDYDRNLIAVLVRFEQHHIKLNVNKMKFLDSFTRKHSGWIVSHINNAYTASQEEHFYYNCFPFSYL